MARTERSRGRGGNMVLLVVLIVVALVFIYLDVSSAYPGAAQPVQQFFQSVTNELQALWNVS